MKLLEAVGVAAFTMLICAIAESAFAQNGCILARAFVPFMYTQGCPEGTGHLRPVNVEADCDATTLQTCGVNQFIWDAQTGVSFAPPPGCLPPTVLGPYVAHTCKTDDQPDSCKIGDVTSDSRKDGSGLVGDPVDLTNGSLSLDPIDIDLGHGLRFARHYSITTTLTTEAGKSWTHSLEWKLTRSSPAGC